ncbi:MAG: redoxin domain-containing protein [Actinobacteria bacterium]|nr:redoxin domain-containing protein [Actinomycetota bacterium]
MAHRIEQKQARRAERLALEESLRHAEKRRRAIYRTGYGLVGIIAATLIFLAVALGGQKPGSGVGSSGTGPDIGLKAPDFTLSDAVTGRQVSLESLAGDQTLLFFSEGVGCQACMVQAADLERSKKFRESGIRLVSVSTDSSDDLAKAAGQYEIGTPMLSDPTTAMSSAYGMLGHGGMGHPNQDGHAFILLDESGTVKWHQAYEEMYVKPGQLLTDMQEGA